jgi:hypothetical protein
MRKQPTPSVAIVGKALIVGGVRVDPELRPERRSIVPIPLAEDAQSRPILAVAVPDDDVAARRLDHDGRSSLEARRTARGLELRSQRDPGGRVALAEDPAPLRSTPRHCPILPDHDEVVGGAGSRDRRAVLESGGERVDAELRTERRARRGIALAKHAGAAAVLVLADPHHHEVAVRVDGHARLLLALGGDRVDPELRAERCAARREALAEDA